MSTHKRIQLRAPRRHLSASAVTMALAATSGMLLVYTPGFAQAPATPPSVAQKIEKIEVTGSSIKKIEGEAALPVQVITRDEIEREAGSVDRSIDDLTIFGRKLADGLELQPQFVIRSAIIRIEHEVIELTALGELYSRRDAVIRKARSHADAQHICSFLHNSSD